MASRIRTDEPAPVFLCSDEHTCALMADRLPGWVCTSGEGNLEFPRLLVRWGVAGGRDGHRTYNSSAAISRAMKPELVGRFWSLYRLPAKPVSQWGTRPPLGRREGVHWLYRVCLFDLKLVGTHLVYRHPRSAKRPGVPGLQARLVRLAHRALYVLGLHGGAVDVWVGLKGPGASASLALAGISAGPRLSPQWADALAGLLKNLELKAVARGNGRADSAIDVCTLGADPEFAILMPGNPEKVVPASWFFPARAGVGTDRVNGRPGRPLGELRPAPSPSPLQLLETLRSGLAHAGRRLKGKPYVLRAGGCPVPYLPTGGHIHFGHLQPDTDTLKALDAFLAIPLFLLEDPDKARLRREKGYGTWGDFRLQPHGFEYRALSSWLVHPRAALAALCLAKTVVTERDYLCRHIPACLGTLSAHRRFLLGDTGMFYKLFPHMWKILQSTPTYRRYEPELRYLETAISQRSKWNETTPLLGAWGIAR